MGICSWPCTLNIVLARAGALIVAICFAVAVYIQRKTQAEQAARKPTKPTKPTKPLGLLAKLSAGALAEDGTGVTTLGTSLSLVATRMYRAPR